MSLSKKTAANRRNSRYSTGPKTAAGKAASSLNALRDGLRAQTIVIPGENQFDFDRMHDEIRDSYPPETPNERYLIEHAVIAQWKLIRLERSESQAYAADPEQKLRLIILDRAAQIQVRLQRAYDKAIAQLEKIQQQRRPAPAEAPTPAEAAPEPDPEAPELKGTQPWKDLPRFEKTFEDLGGTFKRVLFRTEYGKFVDEWTKPCPQWEAEEAIREEAREEARRRRREEELARAQPKPQT